MKIFNRWVIQKEFWLRLGLSGFFLCLLVVHQFIPGIKFDIYSTIFALLAILTWLSKRLKSLEIPGIIKIEMADFDSAKALVSTNLEAEDEEIEIRWNQKYEREFLIKNDGVSTLSFNARINYTHEAGANYLLQVFVNSQSIGIDKLVNKPIVKENSDGRSYAWFDKKYDSWMLCYSPNFKDNYTHRIYKVVNCDPYLFVFQIDHLLGDEKKFQVVLRHNGRSERDAFRNSLIVKNIEVK
jgi:hypothetical protein